MTTRTRKKFKANPPHPPELLNCLDDPSFIQYYDRLDPRGFSKTSALLRDLAKVKQPEDIGAGVSVVALEESKLPFEGLGSNFFFFRDFYDSLLQKIREFKRVVLLGNPGVGKSVFAYYYLWRMIRDKNELPPDHTGNTKRPEVVLFQSGDKTFKCLFLSSLQAEEMCCADFRLLSLMNPSSALYFFEPLSFHVEPHFNDLDVPTVAFCSPDERRYKEFCKNGGFQVYMPCWELEELLAVGTYIRNNDKNLSERNKELLSDENIRYRFEKFGGIFRHVIPRDSDHVKRCEESQDKAIAQLIHAPNLSELLSQSDIGPLEVSHWICQYDVAKADLNAFKQHTLQFVNDNIRERLKENMEKVDLDTRIAFLIRNDRVPTFKANDSRMIYETVVRDLLLSNNGLDFEELDCSSNKAGEIKKAQRTICLAKHYPGHVSEKQLIEDTLYCPVKSNEPVVDYLFRDGDKVYGIQVTRASSKKKRTVKQSNLQNFFNQLGLDPKSFVFCLVPSPSDADSYKIDLEGYPEVKRMIWKLPQTYKN